MTPAKEIERSTLMGLMLQETDEALAEIGHDASQDETIRFLGRGREAAARIGAALAGALLAPLDWTDEAHALAVRVTLRACLGHYPDTEVAKLRKLCPDAVTVGERGIRLKPMVCLAVTQTALAIYSMIESVECWCLPVGSRYVAEPAS